MYMCSIYTATQMLQPLHCFGGETARYFYCAVPIILTQLEARGKIPHGVEIVPTAPEASPLLVPKMSNRTLRPV